MLLGSPFQYWEVADFSCNPVGSRPRPRHHSFALGERARRFIHLVSVHTIITSLAYSRVYRYKLLFAINMPKAGEKTIPYFKEFLANWSHFGFLKLSFYEKMYFKMRINTSNSLILNLSVNPLANRGNNRKKIPGVKIIHSGNSFDRLNVPSLFADYYRAGLYDGNGIIANF